MRGLAGDALERFERTLAIINADCFAVAVAKLKLGQIPVQVLFGAVLQVLLSAVLIDTPHATLEDLFGRQWSIGHLYANRPFGRSTGPDTSPLGFPRSLHKLTVTTSGLEPPTF